MYKIKINEFEGPMDLLLHLIKKSNIEIQDISIKEVTKQYMDYIHEMEKLDIEVASEYLVMASELMLIKSKTLLPQQEDNIEEKEEIEEETSREGLINRLLEYQKYKELTKDFKVLEKNRKNIYTKAPSKLDKIVDTKFVNDTNTSVDDLLKGITMASANDAMVLLAERISGTELKFVEAMNNKGKELGLKNTHFTNCTGFDEENNYSSAYDMALIAKELIKYPKILEYTSKYEDYIRENTNNKTWIVNTNKLVKFYKGADGLKTGYETNAGSTIAATAKKDNLRLIAITLGYSNTNDRNSETMKLLDYGFNQYEGKILIMKNQKLKTINPNKANNSFNIITKENITVLNKKGKNPKKYTYNIKLNKIKYPIKKDKKVGLLSLKLNNKIVSTYPIYADKTVNKAGIFKQYLNVIKNICTGNIN